MTWSIGATGATPSAALSTFIEAAAKHQDLPVRIRYAVVDSATSLARNMANELPMTISSSGHFDADGKGYASITVAIG